MSSLTLISSWLCGRVFCWRISLPGFNPSFENLVCQATLKRCDTTKQSICGRLYICYICGSFCGNKLKMLL